MDPTWVDIASKFGVPVVILCATWWGSTKVLRWVGVEIIIPVRDSLLATVRTVGERILKYLDDNLLWMRALGARVDQMSADQVTHHAREDEMQEQIIHQLNLLTRTNFDWQDPKKTMPTKDRP